MTDKEHARLDDAARVCFEMYWQEDVETYGVKAAARRMFFNGAHSGMQISEQQEKLTKEQG